MKIQNEPGAYGFLAGSLVFLIGLCAWDAGCAHYPRPVVPSRTTMQQEDADVRVITECGQGSGVLLDGTHVLTAFHVVNCGTDTIQPAGLVVVETHDGTAYIVGSATAEPSKDIVRLDLTKPVPGIAPIKIRHARAGEALCASVAVPDRGFRCGHVGNIGQARVIGDIEVNEANLWFGNSGGGVYGDDGQLIGLVTRMAWCSRADELAWKVWKVHPVHTCGGYLSSIDDTSVLP